jgi:hypothetical protein
MVHQLGLGIGRSGDQDRAGIGDRLCDRREKMVVVLYPFG